MNKSAHTFISQLITFQSDHDHPQAINQCFTFVVNHLKKAGLKVKTYSSNGFPSLVASQKLKKHYQYILNGHLDIVPAEYPCAFQPYIKGNRLYGRGASDMKGVVGAMIELIKDEDLKDIDLALMLTTDEEIGGKNGVDYLLVEKGYSCDCAVVPDGGDNFRLINNQKGVIRIEFQAQGKAAHSSQPWQGDNALDKLVSFYQQLKKHIPAANKKKNWTITLNLGSLHGGDVANKVPDKATMCLDFRYPKKKQRIQLLNLIDRLTKKNSLSFHFLVQRPPLVSRSNDKYMGKILTLAKKHQLELKLDKQHSASDAVYFNMQGTSVIIFKPLAANSHAVNEWLDLKSLAKFSQLLKTFLLN